ncbi:MAG TPA: pyridoxamine 5'-phosphate oxidase family protein [Alphaproteobacteria bacterium]|nr:pyridoxamine 5'-phosphate oxidase family protein [Alphaproteobacteria bacterium]
MTREFVSDIAFTSTVKDAQARLGSRAGYGKMEAKGGWQDRVTPDLAGFIAERDSAYLATATADGQPYIQHRGGPKGFIKVLDDKTLALADFSGNRQYVSLGNLTENGKAHLFLMDYPNRRRIKIWGQARMVEDDAVLVEKLADPSYKAKPERALVFTIEAWDVNCPQHITPRFTQDEIEPAIGSLRARIAQLETEVAALRGGSND